MELLFLRAGLGSRASGSGLMFRTRAFRIWARRALGYFGLWAFPGFFGPAGVLRVRAIFHVSVAAAVAVGQPAHWAKEAQQSEKQSDFWCQMEWNILPGRDTTITTFFGNHVTTRSVAVGKDVVVFRHLKRNSIDIFERQRAREEHRVPPEAPKSRSQQVPRDPEPLPFKADPFWMENSVSVILVDCDKYGRLGHPLVGLFCKDHIRGL